MNRRQRKKHRIGEFQEIGFDLRFQTPEAWEEPERSAFFDAFIAELERAGLSVGGRAGVTWNVFVDARPRGSVTAAQREALVAWLEARPGVTGMAAGPLRDAWYGLEESDGPTA